MFGVNVKGFIPGYATQKVSELIIISVCYAFIAYIGSRSSYAFDLGIFVLGPHSILQSLVEGFGVSLGFFLFTLYPFIVLAPLIPIRRLLLKKNKTLIPFASAALSIAYVQLWVMVLGYKFKLFPEWTVSALIIAFIIFSSFKLYPEFSEKYSTA